MFIIVKPDAQYHFEQLEGKLMKMKDSIQRSKAHLLCAAAISIQTQSRRFLARQIAIKRYVDMNCCFSFPYIVSLTSNW